MKTSIQKLWENITELGALLDGNPHVPIQECKDLLAQMEEKVKLLRRREIGMRKT
jgi:predicted aconitase